MKIETLLSSLLYFVLYSCENNYNGQQINDEYSNTPHFIEDNFENFSEQDLKDMEIQIKPIDPMLSEDKLSKEEKELIELFNNKCVPELSDYVKRKGLKMEYKFAKNDDLTLFQHTKCGYAFLSKDNGICTKCCFENSDYWFNREEINENNDHYSKFTLIKGKEVLGEVVMSSSYEIIKINKDINKNIVLDYVKDIYNNERKNKFPTFGGIHSDIVTHISIWFSLLCNKGKCKYIDTNFLKFPYVSFKRQLSKLKENIKNCCENTNCSYCLAPLFTYGIMLNNLQESQKLLNMYLGGLISPDNILSLFSISHAAAIVYLKEIDKFVIIDSKPWDKLSYYGLFDDDILINSVNYGYEQIGSSCAFASNLNLEILAEILNDEHNYQEIISDIKQNKVQVLSNKLAEAHKKNNYNFVFRKI